MPTIPRAKLNRDVDIEAMEHQFRPNGKENIDSDGSMTLMASTSKNSAVTSYTSTHLDPDEYQYAKRKLKKAVLEHYR